MSGELEEYFAGTRREFTFRSICAEPIFNWRAGEPCWRSLTARRAPMATLPARWAAAGISRRGHGEQSQPVAIVVPCHRVIASDGTLCGYGGGLDVKRKLLELEGALTGILAA